jgi:hypothetical protein
MKSQLRNIRRTLKWIGFYIPFTFYFLLFAAAALIGFFWLQTKAGIPDSAYKDIFFLLLRFSLVFCLSLLALSVFTSFFPFIYLAFIRRKGQIDFNINMPHDHEKENNRQLIQIYLHPVLKPLLGFVKIRLKYDHEHFSEKFSLVKQSDKKIFSSTLNGTYHWDLPEIKEYRVDKAIIYFEDFFQFFSFALTIDTSKTFHTYPVSRQTQQLSAFPRKTEETSTRIEEIKKVEGEHINYKNFESNDDVRRIVWKIYAKNKELVVRIPEILDPYASHMYLYASFFSDFPVKGNEVLEIPLLNYYKTICWSVYKQLTGKGFDVRYVPDQDIPSEKMENDALQIRYSISLCKWQTEKDLRDYVKLKDASVVIISSLSDPRQVEQILESSGNEISFIFVPLTEGLKKQNIADWMQWLFVQHEKDALAVYKTSWSLSLLRLKIIKNEKALKQLLDKFERSSILEKS